MRQLAVRVELDPLHVVDGEVVGAGQQGADLLRPVAVVERAPQVVRVVLPRHRLVRGDDVAVLRVEHARQRVERDRRPGPLVCRVPPRHGPVAVTGTPDGHPTRRLVADVSLHVGVHEVLRRHLEQPSRVAELVPVRGPVEDEDRVGRAPRVERGPAQRHGIPVASRRCLAAGDRCVGADRREVRAGVGDERAVPTRAHGEGDRVTTLHLEPFLSGRQLLALSVVQHLVVVDDLLEVEVLHVRVEVGEAPRDGLVVADDHARYAGEREAGDVEGTVGIDLVAVQAHLVPDARHGRTEVRVVGEDRSAAGGVAARDRPGVRPESASGGAEEPVEVVRGAMGSQHRLPAPAQVGGTLGQPRVVLPGVRLEDAVDDGALVHDRLVHRVRVVRIELRDLRTGQVDRLEGPVHLVGDVATEVPGHRLEPGE